MVLRACDAAAAVVIDVLCGECWGQTNRGGPPSRTKMRLPLLLLGSISDSGGPAFERFVEVRPPRANCQLLRVFPMAIALNSPVSLPEGMLLSVSLSSLHHSCTHLLLTLHYPHGLRQHHQHLPGWRLSPPGLWRPSGGLIADFRTKSGSKLANLV